ncbi:MAG: hypothetical protein KDD04_03030 [Sinomicrobium sp.]|nr:hypothetical protein [Sinomicrobium sp.]
MEAQIGTIGGPMDGATAVNYTYLDRTNPATKKILCDRVQFARTTSAPVIDLVTVFLFYKTEGAASNVFSYRDHATFDASRISIAGQIIEEPISKPLIAFPGDIIGVFVQTNGGPVERSNGIGSGIGYIAGDQTGQENIAFTMIETATTLEIMLLGNVINSGPKNTFKTFRNFKGFE